MEISINGWMVWKMTPKDKILIPLCASPRAKDLMDDEMTSSQKTIDHEHFNSPFGPREVSFQI
jgi:hypothetical protein